VKRRNLVVAAAPEIGPQSVENRVAAFVTGIVVAAAGLMV
jgi:hypothetical protein